LKEKELRRQNALFYLTGQPAARPSPERRRRKRISLKTEREKKSGKSKLL
jgi:hypothetical protein